MCQDVELRLGNALGPLGPLLTGSQRNIPPAECLAAGPIRINRQQADLAVTLAQTVELSTQWQGRSQEESAVDFAVAFTPRPSQFPDQHALAGQIESQQSVVVARNPGCRRVRLPETTGRENPQSEHSDPIHGKHETSVGRKRSDRAVVPRTLREEQLGE